MHLRNFILFSNIDSFQFALGIVASEDSPANADESLLPLVAKGDGQAMKRCIDLYGPLVWSIVCRRISERNDAEETCQEIFTEVWQKAGSYNPELARESTFIGMIARRRSIDWQRKQNRLPQLTELESVPEASSATPLAGNLLGQGTSLEGPRTTSKENAGTFFPAFCKGNDS